MSQSVLKEKNDATVNANNKMLLNATKSATKK